MRVVFAYAHQYRVLDQFHVKTSAAGDDLLVGVDPDKGEWRSFRVDRIQGRVKIVAQRSPSPQG